MKTKGPKKPNWVIAINKQNLYTTPCNVQQLLLILNLSVNWFVLIKFLEKP